MKFGVDEVCRSDADAVALNRSSVSQDCQKDDGDCGSEEVKSGISDYMIEGKTLCV
jgi:hypothetical protein